MKSIVESHDRVWKQLHHELFGGEAGQNPSISGAGPSLAPIFVSRIFDLDSSACI